MNRFQECAWQEIHVARQLLRVIEAKKKQGLSPSERRDLELEPEPPSGAVKGQHKVACAHEWACAREVACARAQSRIAVCLEF